MFPRIGKKTADHIYEYLKTFPDPVGPIHHERDREAVQEHTAG